MCSREGWSWEDEWPNQTSEIARSIALHCIASHRIVLHCIVWIESRFFCVGFVARLLQLLLGLRKDYLHMYEVHPSLAQHPAQ